MLPSYYLTLNNLPLYYCYLRRKTYLRMIHCLKLEGALEADCSGNMIEGYYMIYE